MKTPDTNALIGALPTAYQRVELTRAGCYMFRESAGRYLRGDVGNRPMTLDDVFGKVEGPWPEPSSLERHGGR
jgi:hypothetical protein